MRIYWNVWFSYRWRNMFRIMISRNCILQKDTGEILAEFYLF